MAYRAEFSSILFFPFIALLGACVSEASPVDTVPTDAETVASNRNWVLDSPALYALGDDVRPLPGTYRWNATIAPRRDVAPPFACSEPTSVAQTAMANVNAFWGSEIKLCTNPQLEDVRMNAMSVGDTGYVYYDPALMTMLMTNAKEGAILEELVFAHEIGHQVQQKYESQRLFTIAYEQGADCYAGYYLAYRVKIDSSITLKNAKNIFETMCALGDKDGQAFWSQGAHGSCEDRVGALLRGIDGYRRGIAPIAACSVKPIPMFDTQTGDLVQWPNPNSPAQ